MFERFDIDKSKPRKTISPKYIVDRLRDEDWVKRNRVEVIDKPSFEDLIRNAMFYYKSRGLLNYIPVAGEDAFIPIHILYNIYREDAEIEKEVFIGRFHLLLIYPPEDKRKELEEKARNTTYRQYIRVLPEFETFVMSTLEEEEEEEAEQTEDIMF